MAVELFEYPQNHSPYLWTDPDEARLAIPKTHWTGGWLSRETIVIQLWFTHRSRLSRHKMTFDVTSLNICTPENLSFRICVCACLLFVCENEPPGFATNANIWFKNTFRAFQFFKWINRLGGGLAHPFWTRPGPLYPSIYVQIRGKPRSFRADQRWGLRTETPLSKQMRSFFLLLPKMWRVLSLQNSKHFLEIDWNWWTKTSTKE